MQHEQNEITEQKLLNAIFGTSDQRSIRRAKFSLAERFAQYGSWLAFCRLLHGRGHISTKTYSRVASQITTVRIGLANDLKVRAEADYAERRDF